MESFRIEYSITGVVGEIEARAMDPGKGEVISASSRFNNTISTSGKAKQLVGKGSRVYVDASITSRKEAEARVESLMEKMSYRLGSLEAGCVGIPDLTPGRFVEVSGMGVPVDNRFYLTAVTHDFSSERGYRTEIRGCAAQMKTGGF
jgi:phage protein D